MRPPRATVALLAAACAVLPAHAAEAVRLSETRTLSDGSASAAPVQLRLGLYVFRGSRWQAAEVAQALPAVSGLLAQCGIGIALAELHLVEAPRRYHSYSTPVSRELLRRLAVAKPAVFFVDDTLNRPAYDAETIGLANAGTRPELAQTIWVAHGARDLPAALAHELVHLLANSGEHSAEPRNLMRAETSPDNTLLTPAQCEEVRAGGRAQRLLSGRE